MKVNRSDWILRTIALLCLAAVAFALVSQYGFGMRPCAWCVLQRFILIVMAALCLAAGAGWGSAFIHRLGAGLALGLSVAGAVAAWYQYSVAAHSFSCAQTFADRFMSGAGLDAALPWLFGIYASCMDARVRLLGVEYSIWGLLVFVLCGLLAIGAWRVSLRRNLP